ncbi:peptide ABC transporter substrate-binding protein [Campylobacter sp. MIT 99-7217]|uniref:ABC transporter substrate-binding protein n=1 Tax=Campylobacter sp. MIT 99-7217 TaxID=535091 RepID=UPI0011579EE2|nr:ABC transporter substrate-binding protein [Campylobacter sp. MIT 99-7217]TQR32418.1 peptide ABC transporter substrate-binding protein [Campylobacter sp. MIT 99-7217]
MSFFSKFLFQVLILSLLSANLALAKTPKDTLIIGVENEPLRLNPLFSEDHDEALAQIFSGLTRFDENMKIAPDLALSWHISKNGLEYIFKLRQDVFWHDGVKFSAKDVKFSLEALKDPKLNSAAKINFKDIKSVEIINDYELKITLSKPFVAMLNVLSLGIVPSHLLQGKDLNTASFNQNPIGTGAFKFKQWKKGEFISFEANENYHLGKVQSKKLIFKFIKDANLVSTQLKSGEIDAGLIGFESVKSFENDKRFKLLIEKSADYRALMYNLNHPVLKQIEVRRALNYAVNKESIVKNLLHLLGSKANQPLEKSWASSKDFIDFKYDPKKAEQILQKAGWKKNQRGILEKDGLELSFEAYAMSNDSLRVALVNLLKSDFSKLGIELKAIAKPSGSFDYTKIDSFLVGWGSPNDPDLHTFRVFESSQDNEEGWNFGHYKNKIVDQSLQEARTSLDELKRKAEYAKFIKALQEDPPFLFLVYLDFALAFKSEIEGIKPHILGHHGLGFTWNLYEWKKL